MKSVTPLLVNLIVEMSCRYRYEIYTRAVSVGGIDIYRYLKSKAGPRAPGHGALRAARSAAGRPLRMPLKNSTASCTALPCMLQAICMRMRK